MADLLHIIKHLPIAIITEVTRLDEFLIDCLQNSKVPKQLHTL